MKIEHLQIDKVDCFKSEKTSGLVISWSANIGFGELTLYKQNDEDKWKADTECLCTDKDKDFIYMVLNKWIDDMEVEG